MSLLSKFSILTKIIAVVVLLSGVAATIAYFGIDGLALLNDNAERINRNAKA